MIKKVLKVNSFVLIIAWLILMLISISEMFTIIFRTSVPNTFDDLGKFFIVIFTIIIFCVRIPIIISGGCTLYYLKCKKTYKLCMINYLIGIVLYTLLTYLSIVSIIKNNYNENDYGSYELSIIYSMLNYSWILCLLIINMIGLYKIENNLNYKEIWHHYRFRVICIIIIILIIVFYNLYRFEIISFNNNSANNIEITENNLYSYSDFKTQLENRKLIYELPNDKKELTRVKTIQALDSNSKKNGYSFSNGPYTDNYYLSVNTEKKFPMFLYDSYSSLIKKNKKTKEYYYIGPEDWFINWRIYYVNGEIYAAIGEESADEVGGGVYFAETEYGIVVSEKNDITIYNAKKNCYVKDGGILNINSGTPLTNFPTTTNKYNEKCMKIRVVDKVDAETLDEIAKEIAHQYREVHKNNR